MRHDDVHYEDTEQPSGQDIADNERDAKVIPPPPSYKIWRDDSSTLMVRVWRTGVCEVMTRRRIGDTWGPPRECHSVLSYPI